MVENIVAVLATAPSALGLGFGSSKNITNAIMRALAHAQTRTLRMYSPTVRQKFVMALTDLRLSYVLSTSTARRFMAMHRTHPSFHKHVPRNLTC